MYRYIVKRLGDIIVAIVGTIFVVFPLTIIIGICYAFGKDKGPVFFSQERMGYQGKTFKILKFRSMIIDAEKVLNEDPVLYQTYIDNGYKFPEGEDPRLTKIGGFIRRTSLDEFPQFINILKGEMSFIGPRPIFDFELHEYTEKQQKDLFSVRPGVTGWWQVSGRSDVLYPERAELQVYYPRHFSIKLDIKILVLTVKQVVLRTGAH